MSRRFFSGFALLEILVMASLMVGLSAMIIVFSHQKQKEINARKVGDALGYIANEFIVQGAPGGTCYASGATIYGKGSSREISECIDIPDNIKTILKKNDISLDDFSLTRGVNSADTSYPLMQISVNGKFDRKSSAIYAEGVFNSLSTAALDYICITYPLYFDYPPFSYRNYEYIRDGKPAYGLALVFYVHYNE